MILKCLRIWRFRERISTKSNFAEFYRIRAEIFEISTDYVIFGLNRSFLKIIMQTHGCIKNLTFTGGGGGYLDDFLQKM